MTAFLEYKITCGCTQATIDSYRTRLVKLGECISVRCGIALDLHVPRMTAAAPPRSDRRAKSVISRTNFDKILAYAFAHPSRSAFVVLIENHIGVRVSDLCEQMTIKGCYLHLICKGGKRLNRKITPELHQILTDKRFASYRKDDRILCPRANSANAYLRNLEKRLGLPLHSFHDIRRLIAQEKYDAFRCSGMERLDALRQVGLWLNHGPKREDLVLKSYVGNPW